jgi:hypothetical protein
MIRRIATLRIIARSAPSPSSPAPSARRYSARGLTARRGRAIRRPFHKCTFVMLAEIDFNVMLAEIDFKRSSDNDRWVEYWFSHLIKSGLPTEAMVASVLVAAPAPAPQARPCLCGSPQASSPPEPGSVSAGSASRHSYVRAPNRAQDGFDISRIGAARHPHLDDTNHDLDAGATAFMGGLVHLC